MRTIYSGETITEALNMWKEGYKNHVICSKFQIKSATLRKWIARYGILFVSTGHIPKTWRPKTKGEEQCTKD